MFGWWGRTVIRVRWWVITAALTLVAVGATWGTGVFGSLTGGGTTTRTASPTGPLAGIARELGQRDSDLFVLWSSDTATVDDPAFRSAVAATLARLCGTPQVAHMISYLDARTPALVTRTGTRRTRPWS